MYSTMVSILREIIDEEGDYYTPKMAVYRARQCVGMWWAGLFALVAKFGNDRRLLKIIVERSWNATALRITVTFTRCFFCKHPTPVLGFIRI